MPNIPHRAPFVMLLAGLSPFVLDSRLCWLLGTSVHKIGKLRRDNLSSFHIAFTKRCTAKQCEVKQSSAS